MTLSLQGVPEAIQNLREAEIRIWVLTGDKRETAINIGRSCKLITPKMPVCSLQYFSSMIILLLKTLQLTTTESAPLNTQINDILTKMGDNVGKDNEVCLIVEGSVSSSTGQMHFH